MRILYTATLATILLVSIVPLATLVARLLDQTIDFQILFDPSTLTALTNTVLVSFVATSLSILVAVPLGYLLVRTDLPASRLFRRILLFAYVVPPYLFAMAWCTLAVPGVGILNRLAGTTWINIYSMGGLTWVLSTAYLPLLLTSLWSGLESIDPSLEEAARISGATPVRTFFGITLPCLMPHIMASAFLFSLAVMSAFGVPAIVGNPARIHMLTTRIFTLAKLGGIRGIDLAVTLSIWLVLLTGILTLINEKIRKTFQHRLVSGKTSRPSLVSLGRWRPACFGLVAIFLATIVLLPVGAIMISAFLRVGGDFSPSNFTLDNFRYLFSLPETAIAIRNSLGLAFATGLICVLLGFLVAFFKDRTLLFGRNQLGRIASLPFAIPGSLIALGIIISFGTGWGNPSIALLGSPLLLLLAYVMKDIAIGVQSLTPAVSSIHPSLDEAARTCGAGHMRVITSILTPLLLPAFISTFLVVSLPALSELTMSVLLTGPGLDTLGTLLFQLQDYANPLAACSLATLFLGFLSLSLLIIGRFGKAGA